MTTTTQCTENADTTVDAPACKECGGTGSISMFITPDEFGGVACEPCDGTGYQRGDDASLLASEPPVTDAEFFGALMRAELTAIASQMYTISSYERIGDGPVDGACR